MENKTLYRDNLVEITNDSITLKHYYFPSFKPKTILFSDIKSVQALFPTLSNGKWRLQGSGNFRIWFPLDKDRPNRDTIFLLSYKDKWIKNGFTVEDSRTVKKIFEEKGLISPK